jgi:hypothetical protein
LEQAAFTFTEEIEALCKLKRYKTSWRVLQVREEVLFGQRLDIANHPERAENPYELEYYAPILFVLKRFENGCVLKEAYLDCFFRAAKVRSYDMLCSVYNSDIVPSHRCRVTLSHFYRQLGKDLKDWRHWAAFVNGFPPKLFRLAQVPRDGLLQDATNMPAFFDNLMAIRDGRVTSGVGGSLSDLTDSPGKVKERQDVLQERLRKFDERSAARKSETDMKLEELFPELRELST